MCVHLSASATLGARTREWHMPVLPESTHDQLNVSHSWQAALTTYTYYGRRYSTSFVRATRRG